MSIHNNLRTHTVHNQVPDLTNESWWAQDLPLQNQCMRTGASEHIAALVDFGKTLALAK